MDAFFIESESEVEFSDMSEDDSELSEFGEELLQDRQRPKNENYIEETIEQYNDTEFIEHFRINKECVNSISRKFENSDLFHPQTGGNDKINAKDHIIIFLWFAGHQTSSFRDVADRFNISISSLFRVIRRVTYFLSNMSPQVIKWLTQEEMQESEQFFRNKGFPGAIGAIDGSHIRIDKPDRDPDSYYNRKMYFSIQLQAVCDHKMAIRSLFVGFPGSVHDARVFTRSPLSHNLAQKCGFFFILGDSAYGCTRHLITPFKNTGNLTRRQRLFNTKLSGCRVNTEHCFGILKQKFRQLFHCKLRKIPDIIHFIRACCVLHNLSINELNDIVGNENNVGPEDIDLEENLDDEFMEIDVPAGSQYRDYLLRTLNL